MWNLDLYSTSDRAWKKYFWAAIAIPLFIVLGRWAYGGFDLSFFILAGEDVVLENRLQYPIKVVDGRGYDGLTYYQLSLDPTNKDPHAFGLMSNIAYRKQRILYPILSYIFSFGQPELVPYSMVVVNLLAILFSILFVKRILKEQESFPIYLLLISGLVGFHIALTRNLAEGLEGFFLITLFYAVIKDKTWGLLLAAFGVLFARETSALIVGSLGLAYLISMIQQRKLDLLKLMALGVPLLSAIYWKYHLYTTLGGHRVGDIQLVPFAGLLETQRMFLDKVGAAKGTELYMLWGYHLFCCVLLVWIVSLLILALKKVRWNENMVAKWSGIAMVIWMAFALLLNHSIYRSDLSFGRVFNGILIIALLYLAHSKQRLPKPFLIFTFGVYLVSYIRLVFVT